MAHRPEATVACNLPRLRQLLADDLLEPDGQEDHGVAIHLGRRAESGLDVLNQDGDLVEDEVALARQLVVA